MIQIYPKKLLYSLRNDVIDEEFFGFIIHYKNFSRNKSFGDDNNAKFFLRSLSKPIQSSLMADFNTHKFFNFNEKEIAITCASHSGLKMHVDLVQSILNKINLKEENLLCPLAYPLDKSDYKDEARIYHNCSAKHALMLALCVQNSLDIKNYTDNNHPLQKLMYEKHIELANAEDISISKDGCNTPVFALSMDETALAFFNLFNNEKYSFIKNAMLNNPNLIGGLDRLDSFIMRESNGDLIAKVGANGFILIYNNVCDEILIIKMSQNNMPQREIIALNALHQLKWLNDNKAQDKVYNSLNIEVAKYCCDFSFL